MELKKVKKQDRVRKPQEPYPTSERCRPPLWPPTQCTCIPSSLCCSHTTKWTRDASALCWRPERGPASFRSGVGFLRLSNPVLFLYFFQLHPHPYSKWSFFRNFFPLVNFTYSHSWILQLFRRTSNLVWQSTASTKSLQYINALVLSF